MRECHDTLDDVFSDNKHLQGKPREPTERDKDKTILNADYTHEGLIKSRPDIFHFWSLPKLEAEFFGSEGLTLKSVVHQTIESMYPEHVSDVKKLRQVEGLITPQKLSFADRDKNSNVRVTRDTTSSSERKRWLRRMRERRRFQMKRLQWMGEKKNDILHGNKSSKIQQSTGQGEVRVSPVVSRTRVERLARLRRMRERQWRRRNKIPSREAKPSQKEGFLENARAGLPLDTATTTPQRRPHHLTHPIQKPQRKRRKISGHSENDSKQNNMEEAQIIPSRQPPKNTLSQQEDTDTPNQGTPMPSLTSAVPIKLVTDDTVRITSEMTSLYPFIDSTKALDYFTSFSTRPLPRRWPLKVILKDPVTPTPTQPESEREKATGGTQSKINLEELLVTSKRVVSTEIHQTDETSVVTSEPLYKSSPHTKSSSQMQVASKPTQMVINRHRSNYRPNVVSGGQSNWSKGTVIFWNETKGNPDTVRGQYFRIHNTSRSHNISTGRDLAIEDKATRNGVIESIKGDNSLDSGDGSGGEQSMESSSDVKKLIATKRTQKQRKSRLFSRRRQRKARKGPRGRRGRKRRKSRKYKSLEERRAARKRRRRLQRMRRRMLRQSMKNKRVRNAIKSKKNKTSENRRSMSLQQRKPRPSSASFQSPVNATHQTGRNASDLYSVSAAAVHYINHSDHQQSLHNKSNTAASSEILEKHEPRDKNSNTKRPGHVDHLSKLRNASLVASTRVPVINVSSKDWKNSSVTDYPDNRGFATNMSFIAANTSIVTRSVRKDSTPLSPDYVILSSLSPSPAASEITPSPAPTRASVATKPPPHTAPSVNGSSYLKSRYQNSSQGNKSTISRNRPTSESFIYPSNMSVAQQWRSANREGKQKIGRQNSSDSEEGSSALQPTQESRKTSPPPQSKEGSPLTRYRTAYDFLSNQKVNRGDHESRARRRHREYHHSMSQRLCKVFNKRFVPTSIGGRCV